MKLEWGSLDQCFSMLLNLLKLLTSKFPQGSGYTFYCTAWGKCRYHWETWHLQQAENLGSRPCARSTLPLWLPFEPLSQVSVKKKKSTACYAIFPVKVRQNGWHVTDPIVVMALPFFSNLMFLKRNRKMETRKLSFYCTNWYIRKFEVPDLSCCPILLDHCSFLASYIIIRALFFFFSCAVLRQLNEV